MADESSIVTELRQLVAELRQQIADLQGVVKQLREENRQLREQLEQAQRVNARQAAPFRRRDAKKKPPDQKRKPGRKPGHAGQGRPVPDQVDEQHDVPLQACPDCGGPVTLVRPVEQYIEEIPPVRPRVIRLVTYCGHCSRCGQVQSTHPLQVSRAQGAAKVQLGPRAVSVLAWLNKHLGLTMRKTTQVVKTLTGLSVSPGGLSQALDRVADRLAGAYDALTADLRQAPAVHADETSWWVGEPGWWLWSFTTPKETAYRVESSRASTVVKDTLGADFRGVLVSDCLASYNPIDCRKHKCIAHHLQAITRARDRPDQTDLRYLQQWETLLKLVILFHQLASQGHVSPEQLATRRGYFEQWVDRLLARPCVQSGDAAVQNRLRKQREHLLGCLYDLAAEPTNNRAERSLRPAVIARKLSCGNRTDRGRQTWQILASLAQTCHQRGHDFRDFVSQRLALCPQEG